MSTAMAAGDPLTMLSLASTLLAALEPLTHHPFEGPAHGPSREEMIESLLAVAMPETSALLTAVAALSGDEVLRRRVQREVADREHVLPRWLADMHRSTAAPRAAEVTHLLGDGDNVLVTATLPGGDALTAVVYIDHNMGTLVKDAFVVPVTLDAVVEKLRDASGHDPDTVARPLDPAEARARIVGAVEQGAMTFPPPRTDTWPAARPLVDWMAGLLPAGGTGYQPPEWDDEAVTALANRFLATPLGAGQDHDLLSSLLWFGTDHGPGDPMRWSATAVEILLIDWIPRKIVDDAAHLAGVPDLLRLFIRFCHRERGIREELTEQTIAAVDAYEPEYRRIIRSNRPQGPAALLAAMGLLHPAGYMLDALRQAVGGEAALDALDAEPLPDEPFVWDAVPDDLRDRVGEMLEPLDRCCTELLDGEYRTVCRRLLADAVAGSPEIFRRSGRPAATAATICWVAGHANSLFDREPVTPKRAVKDITGHFGNAGRSASTRSGPLLRAIGATPQPAGHLDLGSPRYLTAARRARIIAQRDRYREETD